MSKKTRKPDTDALPADTLVLDEAPDHGRSAPEELETRPGSSPAPESSWVSPDEADPIADLQEIGVPIARDETLPGARVARKARLVRNVEDVPFGTEVIELQRLRNHFLEVRVESSDRKLRVHEADLAWITPMPEAPPPPKTLPPAPEVPTDPIRTVTIDCPLLATPAYAPRNLRRDLSLRHARALRDLADGLVAEKQKVDGHPIRDCDDALAWLLEQFIPKRNEATKGRSDEGAAR